MTNIVKRLQDLVDARLIGPPLPALAIIRKRKHLRSKHSQHRREREKPERRLDDALSASLLANDSSALPPPAIRRKIMKSRIAALAARHRAISSQIKAERKHPSGGWSDNLARLKRLRLALKDDLKGLKDGNTRGDVQLTT